MILLKAVAMVEQRRQNSGACWEQEDSKTKGLNECLRRVAEERVAAEKSSSKKHKGKHS